MSPYKYLLYWVFGWTGKIVASLMFLTCRVQVFGREIETNFLGSHGGRGLLYASWHRGLTFFVYFYRNLKFVVMTSASKDGELAAQASKRFGWIPVRGSSTRRGSDALVEMRTLFEKGHGGGLLVDGPTGPAYISKIGIIVLAKRTGLPIVPVMWNSDRSWRISSWDRTMIPKPFSKIVFLYGDQLIYIPRDASREECEEFREELDERLRLLMFQTDHFFRQTKVNDPREIEVLKPAPAKEI